MIRDTIILRRSMIKKRLRINRKCTLSCAAVCMCYVCPQGRTIGLHISSLCPQNPAANFNLSVQNRCLCLWSNQCGVHRPSAVILIKPSVSVNSTFISQNTDGTVYTWQPGRSFLPQKLRDALPATGMKFSLSRPSDVWAGKCLL